MLILNISTYRRLYKLQANISGHAVFNRSYVTKNINSILDSIYVRVGKKNVLCNVIGGQRANYDKGQTDGHSNP